MTVAQYAPAMTRFSSRWLLLGSLALNLFFVGVALAMAIRAPAPPAWDRNVFVRVEHIADTLPPADADLLRGQINANRQLIDDAQRQYHPAQDQIHETLRREPFDVEAMRAAMAQDARGAAKLRPGHPRRVRVLGRANVAGRPQRFGRLAAGAQNYKQFAIKQANFPPEPCFISF